MATPLTQDIQRYYNKHVNLTRDITLNQLPAFAKELLRQLHDGDVLALSGELASGKTTLTAELVRAMGYTGKIASPTFVLERRYKVNWNNIQEVIHLDFYRLSPEQLNSFDWQDSLGQPGTLVIIEWPAIVASHLPPETKFVKIEITNELTRRFTLSENFSP